MVQRRAAISSILFSVLLIGMVLHTTAPASFAAAPVAVAADTEGGDHADHAETGVPMGWQQDLALFSIITFVLFVLVLKKLAWAPMIEGLDKREAGIRSAIAEADEANRKAEVRLAEYEEKLKTAEQTVADMIAEAKRDAERTSSDMIAKAQADVDAMRARAVDDIQQAKDTALSEVFSSLNSQVAAATQNVLGRALTGDDEERLLKEALDQLSA